MEFRILGPIEAVDGSRKAVVGGKPRALLGFFLLHPNEVLSSERLIDALWDERPPETATAALQVHVSQLRKAIGAERIQTRSPGYLFRLGAEELDAARFEALVGEDRVEEALALWRGSPLAEVRYESWAVAEVARLEELRLTASERRVTNDLAGGRHADLVSELEALVREHPLRERLRAHLMVALYRCGRQAEALSVYQETRRLLVEELGIEPGPELQELHKQVLNQDPSLAPPPAEDEPAPLAAPREERKVVTVLFCDLVGFTTRAEELDPEDVSSLLSRYHLRLRAELERFGGTVEKFIGDAVMALFGAPVAHEDDPERAVLAALAIRDWITELHDDLHVRIGLATGEALVRLGAQPAQGEAMAVGDVVNTAARLQQAAPQDAVVVGESTYRATRKSISYDELDPVAVKGKGKPVPLWVARDPQAGITPQSESRFVGRDVDLALLQQAFDRVRHERSTQLATIVGEPGIGKTRLVAEFKKALDDARWLHGRCLAYGDGITFWALSQIVKSSAGILESDTPLDAETKLAGAVETACEERDRTWLQTRLAPLVGTARGDQTVDQDEAFAAWRTFLEGLAAQTPLVLVFEDLHWADSALLAFLEHLSKWATDVPLFLLCTARPELYEREPGWGGGKRNATTISLAPLTQQETALLVSELLSSAELPEATQATLLDRAGGNPLYAEEFVRMLGDQGLVTRRNGALEVDISAEIPVPHGVHSLIAARLDTLGAERKALIQDASVVGKVFWAGALASMGRVSKESALAGLRELALKEFVRRARTSTIADDTEYVFWHVLVRDVAYAQIPRAARARKHVAAAAWIERISGERMTDHAEFLASHYATAVELTRAAGGGQEQTLLDAAVRFGVLAAERAIRLDQAQGERYFRRTLELLPDEDPRRPKLLADAAFSGTTAGTSFAQIKEELEAAIAELKRQGALVPAANAMRQLSFAMWGRAESLPLAHEARELLEQQPLGPELGLVYERLAQEEAMAGRSREAVRWGEKAAPLLDRFGLTDDALRNRARLLGYRADIGEPHALDELRALAREVIDPDYGCAPHAAASILNVLAWAEIWYGSGAAAAAEALAAAEDLARRRGLERPSHWYKGCLAEPLFDLGRWDEVLSITKEIADWEEVWGQSSIGVFAPPYAARILTARGDLSAADAVVAEMEPRAREVEGASVLWPVLVAAAALEIAQGEPASAAGRMREFEQLTPDVREVAGYLPEVARICWAAEELAVSERLLTALGDDARIAPIRWSGRATVAEAKGLHEDAESLYERAERGWNERACTVEHAHALLGLGRSRIALSRKGDAKRPLQEARTTFTALGARSSLAEADALLAQVTRAGRGAGCANAAVKR